MKKTNLITLAVLTLILASCALKTPTTNQGEVNQPIVNINNYNAEQPIINNDDQINFTEAGNIVNWDSEAESYTNNWKLIYSKPGYNAIVVKLKFNDNSLCDFGTGNKGCLSQTLKNEYNGINAKVEGYKNEDTVIVYKLTAWKNLPVE